MGAVNLTLPATINGRNSRKRKPRKTRKEKKQEKEEAPPVSTAMVRAPRAFMGQRLGNNQQNYASRGGSVVLSVNRAVKNHCHVPAKAGKWICKLFDPMDCEENPGAGHKIPDGAFDSSMAGEARHIIYLTPPTQTTGSIPLDGSNWSVFIWSPPLLRTAAFIIANIAGKDVSSDVINQALAAWNNLSSDIVAHNPEWVQVDETGEVFIQYVSFPLLDKLSPPVNGVSPEFQAYRFTCDGMKIDWNAPALLDQGGEVAVQLPSNVVTRMNHDILDAAGDKLFDGSYGLSVANQNFFLNTPWANITMPLSGPNSSTVVVGTTSILTFSSGSTTDLQAGDLLRLNWTSGAGSSGVLAIQRARAATPATFVSIRFGNANTLQNVEWPLAYTILATEYLGGEKQINVIAIPAFQNSGQVFQASDKSVQNIGHFDGGFKLGKKIFQPKNALRASSGQLYSPIRLATATMNPAQLSTVEQGINSYSDSYDQNFGNMFIQLTGISKSNYPMITFRRGIEVVVNPESVFAMFMTPGEKLNEEALLVSTVVDSDVVHALPSKAFIGGLLETIIGMVNTLPLGGVITDIVGGLVGSVLGGGTTSARSYDRRVARSGRGRF